VLERLLRNEPASGCCGCYVRDRQQGRSRRRRDAQHSRNKLAALERELADIGVIEPSGYLHIVDRIKDVIKTGGEWVSSLQIEDLISQCKGASEAAVIGVKDDKWGERPLALVVRDAPTGGDLSDTQIKSHLKSFADAGVISKYGIPDTILFVKALPKTSVGKFNKNELREKYGKL